MNRSIEARLKKLESLAAPEIPLRRSYLFAAQTDTERDLAIAALVAGGADPDDFFIQLVAAEPVKGDARTRCCPNLDTPDLKSGH